MANEPSESPKRLEDSLKWVCSDERSSGCAVDATTGKKVIEVSPRYFRDAEVDTLLGDSTKARMELGWYPETTIQQMIHEMVQKDVEFAKRDEHLAKGGFARYAYE